MYWRGITNQVPTLPPLSQKDCLWSLLGLGCVHVLAVCAVRETERRDWTDIILERSKKREQGKRRERESEGSKERHMRLVCWEHLLTTSAKLNIATKLRAWCMPRAWCMQRCTEKPKPLEQDASNRQSCPGIGSGSALSVLQVGSLGLGTEAALWAEANIGVNQASEGQFLVWLQPREEERTGRLWRLLFHHGGGG